MILAVVGMKREAAILARVGVRALVGGDAGRLVQRLDEVLGGAAETGLVLRRAQDGASSSLGRNPHSEPVEGRGFRARPGPITALLSFGVAGGLDPFLNAGDLVVSTGVVDSPGRPGRPPEALPGAKNEGPGRPARPPPGLPDARDDSPGRPAIPGRPLAADPQWAARLAAALPGARTGWISGQDTPVSAAKDKSALFAATGALACDMESHVVAAVAARHGLPFAVVRAVSDPAGRSLPPAALAGFGAEGEADIAAVLRALARDPRQLPALIRTGVEAERAFRALARAADVVAAAESG